MCDINVNGEELLMLQVDYCPRCNQLFQKVTRDICPQCMRDLDKVYDKIYQFLRKKENREATIDDIAGELDTDREDIITIIRMGKLNVKRFPNLGYPCESENCNELISEGRLCARCIAKIQDGLEKEQRQKEKEQRLKEEERKKYRTYETF